jgi:hypothetical protein
MQTLFGKSLAAPVALILDLIQCFVLVNLFCSAPSTTNHEWQDGSHGSSFLADKEQTYSLMLSNDCSGTTDELILHFDERVPGRHLDPYYHRVSLALYFPGCNTTYSSNLPMEYGCQFSCHYY